MMAVKKEIFEEILSDPWWSKEVKAARTTKQVFVVVEAYCREKKLKVKHVPL